LEMSTTPSGVRIEILLYQLDFLLFPRVCEFIGYVMP
jgi:hypothetical protein